MARTPISLPLFLLTLLLLAVLTSSKKVTNPSNPPRNAILLSRVSSLTLRANRQTSHRRVPSAPQLLCVSTPEICSLYTIDTMRCTNEGADYEKEDIQWACRADLPEEFKLGGTEVICEGYESSEDPYVLKGSCGVEYRMVLTEKGEKRFGNIHDGVGGPSWGGEEGESSKFAKVIVFAIFGVVVFIIVSGFVRAWRGNPPRLGGGAGGGGQPPWFGGGGDGGDDPPPPYDSHGYGGSSKKSRQAGTRTGSGRSSGSGQRQQQQQGWRPGPWTAGLAGAGLGYALGRGQNRTQTQPQTRQNPRQGGFFGNGGGPSSPSTTPPTFSSSRHSSTGFGGTSRR